MLDHQRRVLNIGRVALTRNEGRSYNKNFFPTRHSLQLMEKIAIALQRNEPILLVGETGIGKTAVVQYLAQIVTLFYNV